MTDAQEPAAPRLGLLRPDTLTVLVVDDDESNRVLLSHVLRREGYHVVAVGDGEAALHASHEHKPDLVLLDVGLPRMDGYELTRRLRQDPRAATLPILLLTGRTGPREAATGLDAGADDFISKPYHQVELLARIRSSLRLRRALAGMEAAHAVVVSLANAVEAKDSTTEQHCQRLALLAARLGRQVGLEPAELDALTYGALLHDVGKIGVAEAILTKPGPLDDEEWAAMRRHPEIGERICAPLAAFAVFGPIIRHHHERWDGRGYPDGLRADQAPIGARIVGLVDAFDAMTHDRPYRAARSVSDALAEIVRESGRQFDPDLVPLFVDSTVHGPSPRGARPEMTAPRRSGLEAAG
jgi:putative two-component system response regulator